MNIFKFSKISKKQSVFKILYSEFGMILFVGLFLFVLLADFLVHLAILKDVQSAFILLVFEAISVIVFAVITFIAYVVIQNICIFIQYMIFINKCSYLPFTEEEMEKINISTLDEYVALLYDISKIKIFTHVFSPFTFLLHNEGKQILFEFPFIVRELLWKFISKRFYGEDIFREINKYCDHDSWAIFLSNNRYINVRSFEEFYLDYPALSYYHSYDYKPEQKDKKKKDYKIFKDKEIY